MYEYSLWSETAGPETRWFWLIDEVTEKEEKNIAGGIENTEEEAMAKIREYIPESLDSVNATLTTTPYCFFDGQHWRYFKTLKAVTKAAKTAKVWTLNRQTGDWQSQLYQ